MYFSKATVSSLFLASATLTAAQNPPFSIGGNSQGCVPSESFDPDFDYFPAKFQPPVIKTYDHVDIFGNVFVPHNTTDLLEITYHKTYKIVTNKFQNKSYLLYQCGTVPPQDEIDSGRHHLVLSIPHQGGLAVTQTPQIPPIELLGLREQLLAYIGDPQYVSSPCMMHMMQEEVYTIETVFDKDSNSTNQALLTAAFLERNPEAIIFGGPYGDKDGDRVMSVAASQERTNVATFDWIALYASLYNLEAMSNKIAAETQARYDCSSTNAAILADATTTERRLDEQHENKTVVLWANYFDGYNWSVAECPTWDKTYYCEYAKHCGADIISRPQDVGTNRPEGSSYWYVSDEDFLELGKDADIFIFPSARWDALYADKKGLLDQLKAVQTKQVFDTQGQGPTSWHEQRLAEYDVAALDFCDLVGNSNPNGPAHERRWFRNIYTEEVGSLGECNVTAGEISEPYVPDGAECTPIILPPESHAYSMATMSSLLVAVLSVSVAFLV